MKKLWSWVWELAEEEQKPFWKRRIYSHRRRRQLRDEFPRSNEIY